MFRASAMYPLTHRQRTSNSPTVRMPIASDLPVDEKADRQSARGSAEPDRRSRDRRRAPRGPCHPPLDEGLIIVAERATPARKPSVKIKVTSTIRALPSPSTIEIDVLPRNAHEPVLPAIDLQFRRSRPLLSQIIAPRVVLSPMGNGRARLTTCNADMAWWCKLGNPLV